MGQHPFGVAVNPVTNRVYAAGFEDGRLSVIDGASNQVLRELYLGVRLSFVGVNTSPTASSSPVTACQASLLIDGATNT